MNVLVIDIGGTNLKISVTGSDEIRKTPSGPDLTPGKMVADAKKLAKGRFDFDDMEKQLGQLIQIGGLKGVMGMLPGVQKIKNQINEAALDDRQIHRQIGIIRSMTKHMNGLPTPRLNPAGHLLVSTAWVSSDTAGIW